VGQEGKEAVSRRSQWPPPPSMLFIQSGIGRAAVCAPPEFLAALLVCSGFMAAEPAKCLFVD